MIQEAVSLMFMQSGKIKAGATGKYNDRYGFWWTAYNAMLAYLKKWINLRGKVFGRANIFLPGGDPHDRFKQTTFLSDGPGKVQNCHYHSPPCIPEPS
jgi:hypothetical protein